MIPFHLFRLPTVFASLTLIALLGACSEQNASTGRQAADVPGSTPGVSTRQAEQALPEECLEAEAAQRACVETLAAKYERIGHPDAARTLRDALPAEITEVHARWQSVSSRDGLKRSCAAARDGIRAQPQCQP